MRFLFPAAGSSRVYAASLSPASSYHSLPWTGAGRSLCHPTADLYSAASTLRLTDFPLNLWPDSPGIVIIRIMVRTVGRFAAAGPRRGFVDTRCLGAPPVRFVHGRKAHGPRRQVRQVRRIKTKSQAAGRLVRQAETRQRRVSFSRTEQSSISKPGRSQEVALYGIRRQFRISQ